MNISAVRMHLRDGAAELQRMGWRSAPAGDDHPPLDEPVTTATRALESKGIARLCITTDRFKAAVPRSRLNRTRLWVRPPRHSPPFARPLLPGVPLA